MEGSITIALVDFGGNLTATVGAVVIYRLISFWGELVVGWAAVGVGALQVRAGRWPKAVAGLGPDPVDALARAETAVDPSPEAATGSNEVGG